VAWQTRVLIVANRTADSEELRAALEERVTRGPVAFTLLVPREAGSREESRRRLDAAVENMRAAGLEVEGLLGNDPDPFVDVCEAWDPRTYDEVIVSTLPTGVSKWLQADLPRRVAKMTDAPVEHVVSSPVVAPPVPAPPPRSQSGVKDATDFISHFFGSKTEDGEHGDEGRLDRSA
jgi:hypothetical protein